MVILNVIKSGLRLVNNQKFFITLLFGFIFGIFLGYFVVNFSYSNNFPKFYSKFQTQIKSKEKIYKFDWKNTTLAEKLYDEVKILCWVLTYPKNHKTHAIHVKKTWGKRCNKLIFISSKNDIELGAIGFNISESRENLWLKTRAAFKYIYNNYLNDYDWFLKADDDSYFIMENLRYMLSSHNSETPIYFGSKFSIKNNVYMSGGAGYVLSKESVKRLVEISFKHPEICHTEGQNEDFELGICLRAINVLEGDTRDEFGKSRFHPLGVHQVRPDSISKFVWLMDYSYYKFGLGPKYVSEDTISFHYIKPNLMYVCEFLIYNIKPYGILPVYKEIPKVKYTLSDELKILKEAEKDRNIILKS